MYNDYTKLDLGAIKEGDKITIVKQSDFGYPINIQIKFESSKLRDWAQYRNCLLIQGKKFRKRKSSQILLKPNDEFVVYPGWVDLEEVSRVVSDDAGVTVTHMGTCFDEETLKKYNDNDLVKIYNTLEGK